MLYSDLHLFSIIGYEGCISDHSPQWTFHPADDDKMTRAIADPKTFMAQHPDWRAFTVRPRHPMKFREFLLFEVGGDRQPIAAPIGNIDFNGQWIAYAVEGKRIDLGAYPFISDAIAALMQHADQQAHQREAAVAA